MATITTRAGKGSALTHQEVDDNFTGLNTELGQKEVASNKGIANGYASLDAAGKVPSAQLPSYVDDVVEVANFASLPGTGETGKIYVTIDTNKTYRWSGSSYIEISASPGSTDSLAEGSTNLYFTQARARASLSASGSLSYNSSTGVISFTDAVTSVAGRTGAVTLTSSDVGLGNVENKSSATIRGELTSSNVTTALGFTPYNATNPSGYITASYSGFMLRSANEQTDPNAILSSSAYRVAPNANNPTNTYYAILTYGNEYNVVGQTATHFQTGETYTRAYNTAWSAWRTQLDSSNYSSYALPLSGGTLTGSIRISTSGSTSATSHVRITRSGASDPASFGSYPGSWRSALEIWNTDSASMLFLNPPDPSSSAYANIKSVGGGFFIDVGSGGATRAIQIESSGTANFPQGVSSAGSAVLTTSNYSSYAPTLTGSGASGTWGISVTGNAATVGGRSPGTSAGNLAYFDSSTAYLQTPSWIGLGGDKGLYAPSGMNGAHFYVNTESTYGTWRILGSRNGYTGISMDAVNGQMTFMANINSNISGVHNQSYGWHYYWENGVFYIGKNAYGGNMAAALDANNYSSYALPLSGGTLSGALSAPNFRDGTGTYNVNLGSGGSEGRGLVAGYSGGSYGGIGYNVRHTTTGGSYIAPSGDTSSYLLFTGGGFSFLGAAAGAAGRSLSFSTLASISAAGTFNAVNLTNNGNQALHAGNYSSYALPLSGGTLSGDLSLTGTSRAVAIYDSGMTVGGNRTRVRLGHSGNYHAGLSAYVASGAPGVDRVSLGFHVTTYTSSLQTFYEAMTLSDTGNLVVVGNVTAYSDERVKANWRQLDDGFLAKLSSVKSGIYDRTDAEITQVGVSAQSLRDVLPHAVIESHEGDLSVAYGNAALVSAVELAKELVALKHKVAELEARVH